VKIAKQLPDYNLCVFREKGGSTVNRVPVNHGSSVYNMRILQPSSPRFNDDKR
jgi:hypothetical protein